MSAKPLTDEELVRLDAVLAAGHVPILTLPDSVEWWHAYLLRLRASITALKAELATANGALEIQAAEMARANEYAVAAEARSAALVEALEECASALDELLGDSDLIGCEDDSPAFLACQKANLLLATGKE